MTAGTWRSESGSWFASIVLGVLIAEIAAATLLTWSFVAQSFGVGLAFPVKSLVIGGIATGTMALLTLTVYLLGFHVVGEKRRRSHELELNEWTARWVAVLFAQEEAPVGRLSLASQAALLALTESMSGEEALRLRSLISSYGIDRRLIADLSSSDSRKRMAALEGLAMARLPQSLDPLLEKMLDARPEMRTMAARAAARTIGSLPEGSARDLIAARFGAALVTQCPARGVFEEMLLLTDDAGASIARDLLLSSDLPSRSLAAVIDAAGRSVGALSPLVMRHAFSSEPEVRAAVLRFLSRMDAVPTAVGPTIVDGIHDEIEFVRVNAVRAARKLAPAEVIHELWARLADSSWWVRKGAAESLAAMGVAGVTVLIDAASKHPDRYGRDMAAQVIIDSGVDAQRIGHLDSQAVSA